MLETRRLRNVEENGNGDVRREPHILAARSETLARLRVGRDEDPMAGLVARRPSPVARLSSSQYPGTRARESKILYCTYNSHTYSAGSQYFPFSTISYEFSQYTINRKHPIMCRDSQMELFASDVSSLESECRKGPSPVSDRTYIRSRLTSLPADVS